MVIDVDMKKIDELITDLIKLLNEYEEVELNVYNQLKDSYNNWRDGNSVIYEDKVQDDKKSSYHFLSVLKSNKDVFKLVYSEYKSIGNKIHFNLDRKDAILNALDDAISKATSALNALNSVDRSYSYSALSSINAQRDSISRARNGLKKMRNDITNLYNKITKAENKIASKIAKLEDIKVDKFEFDY